MPPARRRSKLARVNRSSSATWGFQLRLICLDHSKRPQLARFADDFGEIVGAALAIHPPRADERVEDLPRWLPLPKDLVDGARDPLPDYILLLGCQFGAVRPTHRAHPSFGHRSLSSIVSRVSRAC